jgi:hypothetical protein
MVQCVLILWQWIWQIGQEPLHIESGDRAVAGTGAITIGERIVALKSLHGW